MSVTTFFKKKDEKEVTIKETETIEFDCIK